MNTGQFHQRARRLALVTAVGAAFVGSLALAPALQAQDTQQGSSDGARMDPRQMIDLRMARMTETLKLDSAQQDKIRWMLSQETMAMEELRKSQGGQRGGEDGGGGGGRRGGRGGGGRRGGGGGASSDSTGSADPGPSREMRALRDSTNKQIEAVLNPQQLTTFRQLFEQGQQLRPAGDSARDQSRH